MPNPYNAELVVNRIEEASPVDPADKRPQRGWLKCRINYVDGSFADVGVVYVPPGAPNPDEGANGAARQKKDGGHWGDDQIDIDKALDNPASEIYACGPNPESPDDNFPKAQFREFVADVIEAEVEQLRAAVRDHLQRKSA